MKHKLSPIQYLMLLLPLLTVAGTAALYRFGAPLWRLYVQYSLQLLTHPLIVMFLVLTFAALVAVIAMRRRPTSELPAFCFLLSAVLHLLTVAFFSLLIVEQPSQETSPTAERVPVSPGVPRLSESRVGEVLRRTLQDIAVKDKRDVEQRVQVTPAAGAMAAHEPRDIAVPKKDRPDPDRHTIEVAVAEASPSLEEALRKVGSRGPQRDAGMLIRAESIERQQAEPPRAIEPRLKSLQLAAAELRAAATEPLADLPEPAVPDSPRAPHQRTTEEPSAPAARKPSVADGLARRPTKPTITDLPVQAAAIAAALTDDPGTVSPVERALADTKRATADRPEKPARRRIVNNAPDVTPPVERQSAVGTGATQPRIDHAARRAVEEARTPEPFEDRVAFDVPLAMPSVDAGTEQPSPREPATGRGLTSKRAVSSAPRVRAPGKRPAVEAPRLQRAPAASEVVPARTQARKAPTLTASLAQPTDSAPPTASEEVLPRFVQRIGTPHTGRSAVAPLHRGHQLEAPRSPNEVSNALPRHARSPRQAPPSRPASASPVSLANAAAAETATPAARPRVDEPLTISEPSGQPAPKTVNVGGRLMRVQPSGRSTTLQQASVSARDIGAGYRRGHRQPDRLADVAAPEAPARATAGRAEKQFTAASDDLRTAAAPGSGASGPRVNTEPAAMKSGAPARSAVVPLVPRVAAAVAPRDVSANRGETVTTPTDERELTIARVTPRADEGSLSDAAVPPPRTTFVDPDGRPAATAMRFVRDIRPREASAARTPVVADGVATVPRGRHAGLPVETIAVAGDEGTGTPRSAGPQPRGDRAGDTPGPRARRFSLTRTGGGDASDVQRDRLQSLSPPSRPSRSDRSPARTEIALAPLGRAPASVDDDVAGDTGRPSTSLISAEVAASRNALTPKAIYQFRNPAKRKLYIDELGGSVETESAVEQALEWLATAQSDDGRWDVDGFKGAARCGGRGTQTSADVGITGFTLLAFLGAGYTHMSGTHQATVKAALDWIIDGMATNGDLRRGGQMYDQAMATTALCEALSLTGDTRLLPSARKAVQFILESQNPSAAWRYEPRVDNDTSVTGWQILALKSAELAGIEIPAKHYHWTELWLDKVRRGEQGGLYLYRPGHAVTPVMTAEGWFCQLFMGEKSKTRGQDESIEYLMQHLPLWSPDIPGAINFYYWYYATLALHLSGSDVFPAWNDALTTALMQGRVTEGPAAGTWDPVSHVGERGGRIYSTAVATLCLEVYYRFLPFYKMQ